MVLERPQLHEEQMWTRVAARGEDEARLDDAVRRGPAESADPPLRCGGRGRVQLELARRGEGGRGGLERGDVGAVAELGLEVAAEDAAVRDEGGVLGVELGRALGLEDGLERCVCRGWEGVGDSRRVGGGGGRNGTHLTCGAGWGAARRGS